MKQVDRREQEGSKARGYMVVGVLVVALILLVSSIARNALKHEISPPPAPVAVIDSLPAEEPAPQPAPEPSQVMVRNGVM
jgi:hypothetical protein